MRTTVPPKRAAAVSSLKILRFLAGGAEGSSPDGQQSRLTLKGLTESMGGERLMSRPTRSGFSKMDCSFWSAPVPLVEANLGLFLERNRPRPRKELFASPMLLRSMGQIRACGIFNLSSRPARSLSTAETGRLKHCIAGRCDVSV